MAITVDSEALTGPIKCEDHTVLRNFVRRGENRILSGADGRRRNSLKLDQLDETLTFRVNGMTVPVTGAVNADPVTGLEENVEHYRSLFLPDIAHDLTLAYAGSTFTTDECQFPEFAHARQSPTLGILVVRIVILAGQLAEVP